MSNSCPKCGSENPDGITICVQCASPLATACPKCGFANPANFKFCGNCGANLGASLAPAPGSRVHVPAPGAIPDTLAKKISQMGKQLEGERRNVTVLFSDISGFTAISEKLDPEEVYNFIDSTLKAFTDEIYKHEGTLDKVMGDGLMAFFGAPVAHEDDPARAVRAALGMQEALKRINADLEARLGISLRIRIGLNSGTVVVGNIGSDLRMEYTVLGDTVNVASRLQTVAEPGTILVSRSVYEPTKPLFEYRELGSIRVKNRVEPVEIFEALAPRQVAGRVRGIPGLSAPMVGRQDEFLRLRQAVDDLTLKRQGRIVLVTGNAGIGKSRLTFELKGYLANKPATILEGACLAYGQPAYGVFLQILKSVFEIADGDPEEIIRDKIERSARNILRAEQLAYQVLPYIEYLFSIRIIEKEMAARIRHLNPAQVQQQTFIAIRDLLVAQAQVKPLVIIFEDIHWIDSLSLDLLIFLLSAVESAPILIYCNSRPADGAAAPKIEKLGHEMYAASFLHLPLSPLSRADSVALIDLLLTIHELPETLRQIIPQRAEGNPFYLEEIVRMLIDHGIIHRNADRWELMPGADVEHFQVPSNLHGLIMARVDNLTEGSRQAIQYAAVIGRRFSYRLLNTVTEGERNLLDDLRELEERQLIQHTAAHDDAEYDFSHILIQDTIYNSLLVRRREYLHHKIANGIEILFKDRPEEYIEQLAFHYTESKDLERALPYLIRAGKHSEERFANEQALRNYRLAADTLTQTHPTAQQKIDIYTGLGAVETFVGDYAAATTSYLIALELVRNADKTRQGVCESAEIMRLIGRVCERRGDYVEALRWLNNALTEMENDPDPKSAVRVRIYNDIGWVNYRQGRFDLAYDWGMKSLRIVEGTDYYSELASAYNRLVALCTRKGDWERAQAYGEKALHLRETIGDLTGVSGAHNNLGNIALGQCDWNQALHHFEQVLEIRQKTGDARGIAQVNNNLGIPYREKGDCARATQYFTTALEMAERIKDGNATCLALNNLAHTEILQDQFDRAILHANRSLDIAMQIGHRENQAEARSLLAETYFGKRQLDLADENANQAAALAAQIGSRVYEGQSLRTLAKIARARGNLDTATEYIRHSLAILTELKNPFELAKSQFQLALLQRDQGDNASARATLEQTHATFKRLGAELELARTHAESQRLNHSSGTMVGNV